jgi:hypothetical protein
MRFENYIVEAGNESNDTRLQEGVHCVAFGIYQLTRGITKENLTDQELFHKAYDKYCVIDASEDELFGFINDESNSHWIPSVIGTVKAGEKSGYLKKNDYKFYRTLGLMGTIYNEYNRLKKQDKIPLGRDDKWNPSDIWASKHTGLPKAFGSLMDFNGYISEMLEKGEVVGISLKQNSGSPKAVKLGPNEKPVMINYELVSKGRKVFPTGIKIQTAKGIVFFDIRSFNIASGGKVSAEIHVKGSKARHGKVQADVYRKFVGKYGIPQMSDGEIKNIMNTEESLKNLIAGLWRDNNVNFSHDEIEKGWEKDQTTKNKKDMVNFMFISYWRSILHSLQFGAFLRSNRGKANQILTDFYMSGKATTEYSSEYIKIS